ncbi:formate dehydrogenase accessory protein FdhE [Chloroflexota bacterium]
MSSLLPNKVTAIRLACHDYTNDDTIYTNKHLTVDYQLVSHAKALYGSVNQERWRRGYCPICGSSPDFAYLDKEYGARWLLCSRCDTGWLFQRLECPYCGTQDQNALAYYTDDEGLYRLYICEQCHQYLKAVDLRQAKSEVLLPLERLFTLALDAQAQEAGYSPGIGRVITK